MFGQTLRKRSVRIALASTALACVAFGLLMYRYGFEQGLPYRDEFAKGRADEWTALGGTWELADGSMRNDSDERGAKLLTGSLRWSDYSVEADVMLLGLGGDAGLLLRSNDEELGVDAYTGYYAGLRTVDDSLVLGRAGHGWVEMNERLPLGQPGIRAMQWYHLKLLAFGCQLATMVNTGPQQKSTTIAITDEACIRSGRAGLRSYASGGVWRNVVIRPAKLADLTAMLALASAHRPGLDGSHSSSGPGPWDVYGSASTPGVPTAPPSPAVQPISSLRLESVAKPVEATIRGGVVLASPALFVQDATGGVAVQQSAAQSFKVGDEVEVTGTMRANAFSPTMERAVVRVLWENTPMPPVSFTASQAATGAFDSTFIEVEGRLTGKQRGPDDSRIFSFDAGPQSFRAVMNRGRGDTFYSQLKLGSSVRLRGIAVADSAYTHDLVPFALLLRSSDDAVILAGPPWWSAGHLLSMVAALVVVLLAANFIYHRVESWRLRAVLDERERMAYEMHDTLSQSFAGIGFQLKAIREGMPEDFPRLHQQLELASELVRHSHEETRRSIAVLRPEQPGSGDLLTVLRECASRLVEGGSVQIVSNSVGESGKTPLRIADTLYHIGQEALANAVRHAQPTVLTISLTCEKSVVSLYIQDDGKGFRPAEDLPGFGLRSMRKRAADIGATLTIRSSPGRGTEVCIRSGLKGPRTSTSRTSISAGDLWRQIRVAARTGRPNPNSHRG